MQIYTWSFLLSMPLGFEPQDNLSGNYFPRYLFFSLTEISDQVFLTEIRFLKRNSGMKKKYVLQFTSAWAKPPAVILWIIFLLLP